MVAHQGGWDEVLLVAVPLGLMAWLLWLANRRAGKSRVVGCLGGREALQACDEPAVHVQSS